MNASSRRIVIDTNVISELYKPIPDSAVVRWLRTNEHTCMTSITIMELMHGLWRMPEDRRRTGISAAIKATLDQYHGRILPFEAKAAIRCSLIQATLEGKGLRISLPDAQIAAIAHVNACAVATRNTKDFEHTGVPLINPWME